MAIGSKEVRLFIAEIWQLILCQDVEPSAEPLGVWPESLLGCVQITGAWRGTVSIEMPTSLARRLTATMMALDDPSEATPDLVKDALGELVNMFGGNVKAVLPPPCYLSLPAVGPGGGGEIEGVLRRNLVDIGFNSGTETFRACISQVEFDDQLPIMIAPKLQPHRVKSHRSTNGTSLLQQSDSMLMKVR